MLGFKLDVNSNDITALNGKINLLSNKQEAVRQRLSIKFKTFENEWFLDTSYGMPYRQQIIGKGLSQSEIDAIYVDEIFSDPDVVRIEYFNSTYNPLSREYDVDFEVITEVFDFVFPDYTYGEGLDYGDDTNEALTPSCIGLDLKIITVGEQLFKPSLWTINGVQEADFSLITSGNQMMAYFTSYYDNDLIGLIWESEDRYSHLSTKYHTYNDYSGVTFDFDVEMSATMPLIDDQTRQLTLTVEKLDGSIFYVPLYLYATTPNSLSSNIVLDFDNLSNGLGDTLDPTDIKSMFFGLVTSDYVASESRTLRITPVDAWFKITINSVTTKNNFFRNYMNIPPHSYGMSTSYDDIYNLSPERVVKDILFTGYRGRINHYCGMSKYPAKFNNGGSLRFVETAGQKVNLATKKWHENFVINCANNGFTPMFSVSYEMFSVYANTDYAQRDWDGVLGTTGYEPPSYLISPCIEDGMTYLKDVFVEFATIQSDNGSQVLMQVGEPWWWWQPNTRKPCVYDFPTKVKFNNETGLFAPDFGTIDSTATGTPYTEFKNFLQKELGLSVLAIRDAIKAVHPTAQVTALFFLPSIVNEAVGIMQTINYPVTQYSYPNLDFFMTEVYDWVISGEMTKTEQSVTLPNQQLGYPLDKIEYLSGFVPDEVLAAAFGWTILDPKYKDELWGRIKASININERLGVGRQYIWASSQANRDGLLMADKLTDCYIANLAGTNGFQKVIANEYDINPIHIVL